MEWPAADGPWPGRTPGQGPGLPGFPEGFGPAGFGHACFDHDGTWATAAPSAALAVALEEAAGPEDLYPGAETDALVGIARQWAAVESWAAAGKLAALRAMTREDAGGRPLLRRRPDLPDGWDDSLTYEVSGALAMGPVSAGNLASLAWTLGTRLAGTGRLLANGTLTLPKAKLIAQLLEPLDDGEAARAEALILGELAGKTYPQVERLAWRAALAVAPDAAQRRRAAAERQARVTVFREESGAVGLSGRDLPAAEALAGHASVVARARQYQASGAFGGESTSRLQAIAYTDLLSQVSARDRIAFAASTDAEPPAGSRPDGGNDDGGTAPGGGDPGAQGPDDDGGGPGGPGGREDPRPPGPPLAEVSVPLATLQGVAERAGDSRLPGPLDPALARDLAAAAARSPWSRWEIIVTDEHGHATGHGTARPARGTPHQPQPPPQPPPRPALSALPARVSITVTETFLHQLEAQATQPARPARPRPGAPPGAWHLTPRKPGHPGTWALTLPGGRQLTARLDVVPTYDCDHRYAVSSYLPGARSRRCHQVKQLPGWTVTQPRPGWHVWTSPTGRTYVQEPWRYTA